MKLVTCGGLLASAFAVALGITNLLLITSLPENGAEITGSIKTVEPFAPVKLRATQDIFASGSAELVLLPEPVIPGPTQPTSSEPSTKASTAKQKRNSKHIDGPSLLAPIPPPI
jgi:hypothetical protein